MRGALLAVALAACGSDGSDPGVDAPLGATGQPCTDFFGTDYAIVENPNHLCNIDLDGVDYLEFTLLGTTEPAFIGGRRPDGSSGSGVARRITNTTWEVNAVLWTGMHGKAVALRPDGKRCRWMRCL